MAGYQPVPAQAKACGYLFAMYVNIYCQYIYPLTARPRPRSLIIPAWKGESPGGL